MGPRIIFLNLNQVPNYFWRVRYTEVQWNVIVDILYGQPSTLNSTMDNFLRNRWNDVQTFITKPLCSGHQSIADITFMSQITLLPRTGPIRNIYTFYFRYCLTVWFKFSSIFSDLFWSIKKKNCRDFQSVFTSMVDAFPSWKYVQSATVQG